MVVGSLKSLRVPKPSLSAAYRLLGRMAPSDCPSCTGDWLHLDVYLVQFPRLYPSRISDRKLDAGSAGCGSIILYSVEGASIAISRSSSQCVALGAKSGRCNRHLSRVVPHQAFFDRWNVVLECKLHSDR